MSFGGEISKSDRMSPREEDVLRYLAAGLMNKQIAWELGIGEVTVKALVSAVFKKLGVHSRSEAALLAHSVSIPDALERARAALRSRAALLPAPEPEACVEASVEA